MMPQAQPANQRGNPMKAPQVRWSRWKSHSHVAVWLAAVVAAILFFAYGAHTGGMPGYVEIVEHPVASLELGRLVSVEAAVGDRVVAGQPLARFDSAVIDSEVGAAEAVHAEMETSVPAPDQMALQWERQFAAAMAAAAAAVDDQRVRQAQEEAELEVVSRELARLEPLLESRLVDAGSVAAVRARHAALSRSVAMYPETIAGLRRRMEETRRQYGEATGAIRIPGRPGTGTNLQAVAQAMTLAGLRARRQEYVLRSPAAGIVSQVMFRPGDAVAAGTPVIVVIETPSTRVIGFIPEINAREAKARQAVSVERMYGLGTSYPATVTSLEPAIRGLPGQVNPVPGRVMRGRRIYCELTGPTDLLPGETVQIRLRSPFWAPLEKVWGWTVNP